MNSMQKQLNLLDVVIVDEAHHAPADTYLRVIKKLEPKFFIGISNSSGRKDIRKEM